MNALLPTLALALAITTAFGPASTLAATEMAVLRVSEQGAPVELPCPRPQTRQQANRPVPEADIPAMAEPSSLDWTPLPPAHAYPKALKVGLWGDSHTASGTFTDQLLEALRLPLAHTHPSFLAPTWGLKGVKQPLRRVCLSEDWQSSLAYRTPKEGPENYTKSLSAIHSAHAGAFLWLDFRYPTAQTRLQWADLHLAPNSLERGLTLGIRLDSGAESVVQLPPGSTPRLRVQGHVPFATLQLRVMSGAVRIDGIAPVYEAPSAVVLDVYSIPGATAKGWRIVNPDHLRREDTLVSGYDVVILQSGTNESLDPDFKVPLYERQLSASLSRLKAAYPRARCVLIGPPDARQSSSTVRLINDSQYRLAMAQGCAHWHWQKAMGGPGSAQRWLAKGWMQADLLHLTPEGYAQSARSFKSMVPIKPR